MTIDVLGFVVAGIVAAAGAYGFHKAGKLRKSVNVGFMSG